MPKNNETTTPKRQSRRLHGQDPYAAPPHTVAQPGSRLRSLLAPCSHHGRPCYDTCKRPVHDFNVLGTLPMPKRLYMNDSDDSSDDDMPEEEVVVSEDEDDEDDPEDGDFVPDKDYQQKCDARMKLLYFPAL